MELWESTLRMVAALAVVLGVMAIVMYFARGVLQKRGGWLNTGPMMRVMGSLYLGSRKSITVVEVGGEVLVVGATASDMRLLSKMRKTEWDAQNSERKTMGEARSEQEYAHVLQ